MRNVAEYTILDRIGILTAAFTAATTGICTSASHGLKNGDAVVLTTTTTLPAGLALATVYYVIEAATNTFKLSLTKPESYTTGLKSCPVPAVAITDTGTGTHTFTMHDIGNNIYCEDFRHVIFSLDGYSDNNCTVKFVGSVAETCPDFSAAQAYDNPWDYIEVYDLEDGSAIDGDTGVVQAGTNDHRLFELNINGLTWVNAIITAWSAGNVTVKAKLFND
jgi:hypothetical protein